MNGIAGYTSNKKKKRPVQTAGFSPTPSATTQTIGFKPTPNQADNFAALTAGSTQLADPAYLAAKDQGERQTAIADATAAFQQNQLQSSYGFDAQGGIDANNPYSRAALLQESYRRARQGNSTSYAAQGQLYSGALQNAQDESTRNYNIGYDQLAKGYAADQGNTVLNQLSTYGSATGGVSTAALQALLNKLKGGS